MTSNMEKSKKMIVEGDRYVDRLSSLPADLIECILTCMPTLDAARTCVLSSRWRYAWVNHPSVVLDNRFWIDLHRIRSPNEIVADYPNIVSSILQHHVGHIRNFVIYVPAHMNSMPHVSIDTWLSSVCGRGLKVLKITSRGCNPYKVPCLVFLLSDLIELTLNFGIIRSQCFSKIQTLRLRRVGFQSSVVLTTPFLTFLGLFSCRGIIHFDISAPKLEMLVLHDNDDLNLKPFLSCTGILCAYVSKSIVNAHLEGRESVCLVKLLAAWPRISALMVNGFCFKYLATGRIPSKLDQLKLRYVTILDLSLDSELMSWILFILRNSPLLDTLKVSFGINGLNGRTSDNFDESRIVSDFQMNQLHHVCLKGFTATLNELLLAKILLHCAPVLEEINVEENAELDAEERSRISKNLLYLQHARPKPRIVFRPNMQFACPWINGYRAF